MAVKQHSEICRLQRAQLDSTERVLQQLRMVPTQSQALNELSKSRDEAIEKWTASQQEVAHLRQLLRLKQEEVAALRIQQSRLSLVSSTSTSTTSLAAQGKSAVGSASARSVLLDALRPAIVIDVTSALPVPEILSHGNPYQSDEAQGRSVDSVAVRHQQLEEVHDEDVAHPQLRHVDYRTARPARDWAASCGPSHRLMAAQQDVSPCVEMVLQAVGHTATGAAIQTPSSWIQEALGGPTAATVAEATAGDRRPNSSVLGESSWRAALAAQEAIIQSLETENKSLRQDRDEKIRLGQQEHKRLMEELEEAQTTLDENSAEWQEKQRELNRLRTLMRFSQLKRDSDRLQEMYKRLDELENTIRHHHAAQRSIAMDQDDLQRLRSVEVQLVKVMEGQMQWRSFPFSLLKTTRRTAAAAANGAPSVATAAVASAPPPLSSMAAAAPVADRMRPSSMTLSSSGGANQALPAAPPQAANTAQPLLQHTTVERRRDDTVVGGTPSAIPMEEKERSAVEVNADSSSSRGGLSASSRAAGAASVRQPPAPPEDHDVSFSTIAARMEDYLRKKQAEQLTRGGPKPGPSSSSSEAAPNGAGAPTLLQRQQAQADTLCQSNFVRRLERLKTRQENPSGGIPLTSGGAVGGRWKWRLDGLLEVLGIASPALVIYHHHDCCSSVWPIWPTDKCALQFCYGRAAKSEQLHWVHLSGAASHERWNVHVYQRSNGVIQVALSNSPISFGAFSDL
jgi:hypothetical protein